MRRRPPEPAMLLAGGRPRLLASARAAVAPTLVVFGFVAAVLAWLPINSAVVWTALFVEFAVVLSMMLDRPAGSQTLTLPIALLILGISVETVRSPLRDEALAILRSYLAVVLFYYIGVLARLRWVTKLMLTALFVGSGIAVVGLLYLWAADPDPKITVLNRWLHEGLSVWLAPQWRTRVEHPSLNVTGFILATLVPLAFVRTLRDKGVSRFGHLVGTVALIAAVVLTSGRSSWLGVAIGLVVASLVVGRRMLLTTFAVGAGGLLVLAAISADPTLESLINIEGRLHLWQLSLAMLSTSFPFGLGLGAFPYVLVDVLGATLLDEVVTNPHNSLIQLMGDAGLLGIYAFVIGFALILRSMRDIRRGSIARQGAVAALFAYGAIGMFESLIVFAHRSAVGSYVFLASPIPWLLLAVAERERNAQPRPEGRLRRDHIEAERVG